LGVRLEKLEQNQQHLINLVTSFVSNSSPADAAEAIFEEMPNPCQKMSELRALNLKIKDEENLRRQLVSALIVYYFMGLQGLK
jgi:hypothetical protein